MEDKIEIVPGDELSKDETGGEEVVQKEPNFLPSGGIIKKSKCRACGGTGSIPTEISSNSITEDCNFCQGTGLHVTKCKKCKKGVNEEGDTCKTCSGTGVFFHRKTLKKEAVHCKKCNGLGTITKKDDIIKKMIECRVCDGKGETDRLRNPVLNMLTKI